MLGKWKWRETIELVVIDNWDNEKSNVVGLRYYQYHNCSEACQQCFSRKDLGFKSYSLCADECVVFGLYDCQCKIFRRVFSIFVQIVFK